MNTLRIVAAAALLIGAQAYATTIMPNTLTATPGTTARQINFKLPLTGNTANCIVTIAYGEQDKPGNVYPNNDGDTHINGAISLDRVRTYTNDGTYTFTAKAKSGCTGEAKVTFTIGNPAPKGILAPTGTPAVRMGSTAPVGVTVDSHSGGIKVTPTTITSVEVESIKVTVGQEFFVKQHGAGDPKNHLCGSDVELMRTDSAFGYSAAEKSSNYLVWPKVQTFSVSQPGTYKVRLKVNPAGAAACGYTGPGTIKGDLTQIEVWDGLAK